MVRGLLPKWAESLHLEAPLATGAYACSGVVKNNDSSQSRGYPLVTLCLVEL